MCVCVLLSCNQHDYNLLVLERKLFISIFLIISLSLFVIYKCKNHS